MKNLEIISIWLTYCRGGKLGDTKADVGLIALAEFHLTKEARERCG